MPREKWLVDPGEFDEFQREIAGLSINDSYVIKGAAGSGKTVLALDRVNNIRIEVMAEDEFAYPNFTLIVYTKALRSFIRSGALEKGINLDQVVHYAQWDKRKTDYLVIDEAQDFSAEEIDGFLSAKSKSIMLYGDSKQQLYSGRLSIEEIQKKIGLPFRELKFNYRLPKTVAAFATYLTKDGDLVKNCVKAAGDKPKIRRFNDWKSELNFIINEIKTRNLTDIAILLPFNVKNRAPQNNFHRNVETVKEYFDEKGFRHQFKIRDDEDDTMELDFDSDLPKVMTYHSSKGLQFETVFIPFCDFPNHDTWFDPRYRKPLYVALTRTYRNLYITHSEALTRYFDGMPRTLYE